MIILNEQLNSHADYACAEEKDWKDESIGITDRKNGRNDTNPSLKTNRLNILSRIVLEGSRAVTLIGMVFIFQLLISAVEDSILTVEATLGSHYFSAITEPRQVPCTLMTFTIGILFYVLQSIIGDGNYRHNFKNMDEDDFEIFGKERRGSSKEDKCRIQVMKILGSIQAPPLIPSKCGTSNLSSQALGGFRYYSKLVHLSEIHASLIDMIDRYIEFIRMTSSIRLGLGPCSPVVERVERSLYNQNQMNPNSKSNTSMPIPTKLSSHKVRMILFGVIQEQYSSLHDLLQIFDFEQLEKEHSVTLNTIVVAKGLNCYPLHILKACRRCNGELLSIVLSHAFHSHLQDNIITNLDASIRLVTEQRKYISSCLGDILGNSTDYHESLKKNQGGGKITTTRKQISDLQKYVHISNSLIWSIDQQYGGYIDSENDDDLLKSDEFLELWDDITSSLETASAIHQTLNQDIFSKRSSNEEELCSIEEEKGDDLQSMKEICEHFQSGGGSAPKRIETPRERDKTIVFHGQGSKQGKDRKFTHYNVSSPRVPEIAMARITVLKELESRLKVVDFPEEIEANSFKHIDNNNNLNVDPSRDIKARKAVDKGLFLGVSSQIMLSELKNAISNKI